MMIVVIDPSICGHCGDPFDEKGNCSCIDAKTASAGTVTIPDMDIELNLPVPPSVNEIWRSGPNGFYLSPKYKQWKKAADAVMLADRSWRNKKITGRYTAWLIVNETMIPTDRDLDNMMKVVLDYAVRLELVSGDSVKHCREIRVRIGDAPTGAKLILRSIGE